MFKNVVAINKEVHANTKIKAIDGFDFANELNIASLMVHEFARAGSTYPIVFIEDKTRDEFRPVALLGLKDKENLFVNEEGKWQASYIPAIIRRYPFALASGEEAGRFTVCLDNDSALVNEEAGQPLFNEDGSEGEVIERVKRYLGELQQMEVFAREFTNFFKEQNLFTPLNLRVKEGDSVKNIAGCYVINEERLNSLSDEAWLTLKNKHYMAPVYAHLTSLAQIERLLRLKQEGKVETESVEQFNGSTEEIH